jgi:hypothetical protein
MATWHCNSSCDPQGCAALLCAHWALFPFTVCLWAAFLWGRGSLSPLGRHQGPNQCPCRAHCQQIGLNEHVVTDTSHLLLEGWLGTPAPYPHQPATHSRATEPLTLLQIEIRPPRKVRGGERLGEKGAIPKVLY